MTFGQRKEIPTVSTQSLRDGPRLQAYRASVHDQPQVLRLLEESRRSFAAFGPEDLPQLLASGACTVALDGDAIGAFLCVSVNRAHWAFVRGVAIKTGWRTDEGLRAVLEPAISRLLSEGATHLAVYGTALWLPPALLRTGFERREWIVSLERHSRPLPDLPAGAVHVRPVRPDDLGRLAALDAAIFEPPYQLASGELIELMVTSGHFVLAEGVEEAGQTTLLGYACADVLGDTGQIIRLAVHPGAQRQGIGRTLLNHGLAYCHANGARQVVINTQESNAASLRLYEQIGFRRVGRRVPLLVRSL
jgi:[ribosomal protein S18]-alanine N-acetyltransferase